MIKREYKKLIQKNRDHCDSCTLVKEFCICNFVPIIDSDVKFILLTHSNELKKRTNTGILIEKSMENTSIIEWIRKEPSKELLDIINSELQVYILYPETDFVNTSKEESIVSNSLDRLDNKESENTNKEKYIIILDGTWQEAQKMYNRSEYLKSIKRISLNPDSFSDYKLRRKKDDNHLCTVEAAIITLQMFDEEDNSDKLKIYFEKFQTNYKYSQSN
ncbi:MAG: tRNA-uridine aminocarboxypropyltransferase [Acidaminobacteraceae bacterium]